MVSASDLIHLGFNPDLVQAGIAVACHSLSIPQKGFDRLSSRQLWEFVAEICLELAFRRYLSQQSVPHRYLETTPFSAPDRQDIALGGRKCVLVSSLVTRQGWIERTRQNPATLLDDLVVVPHAARSSTRLQDDDLYIFGISFGRVTPNLRTIQKAQAASQPLRLIHQLPPKWGRSDRWRPLGDLVLKSNCTQTVLLKLNGQGADRAYLTETITLPPGERIVVGGCNFYTLSSLHTHSLPSGAVDIHSPTLAETRLVEPVDWQNLWIDGVEISLAGYLPCGEFHHQAASLSISTRVSHQVPKGHTRQSLPVTALRPLADLLERAKAWRSA